MPRYGKLMKKGDSMTPQITSADIPSASVTNEIALPPTIRACLRSPRRQTVIAASTKKMRSNNTLSIPTKVHGFGTPTGAETVSPPHQERCRRLVIFRKLRFGLKRKLKTSTSVKQNALSIDQSSVTQLMGRDDVARS